MVRVILWNSKAGEFQFKIAKRISDVVFHVEGNAVSSEEYQLKVVAVPIANFEMQLNYPLYLNRKSEVVNGTGNAIIPRERK
jgi:hypothetical protein